MPAKGEPFSWESIHEQIRMLRHNCGYELEILCRNCGKPIEYRPRQGLICPYCGRVVTLVCPGCGTKW